MATERGCRYWKNGNNGLKTIRLAKGLGVRKEAKLLIGWTF